MKYLLLNKPLDMLCQFTDALGRPTLADCVAVEGVYSVGRLDADSEGLVLLTDDGALKHRLAEPRYKVRKRYLAQVEGTPTKATAAALVRGVTVGKEIMRAAAARVLVEEPRLPPRSRPIRYRKNVPTGWLEIELVEGKNRQVRRMTAAVGLPTLRLVRVAIGPLELGTLGPGQWRELTAEEVAMLRGAAQVPVRGATKHRPP